MNTLLWLLRREWWETRSAWLVPAGTALVIAFIALFGLFYGVSGSFSTGIVTHLDSTSLAAEGLVTGLLIGVAIVFVLVLGIVQYAYLVDALYNERKDRSILFWKSLPIGDAITVVSKLVFATVLMPLVSGLAILVTQWIVVVAVTIKVSSMTGLMSALWSPTLWARVEGFGLFELIALQLWALPLMAWVLFVSAVAPRSPALLALLIPLAVALIEKLMLGTHALLTVFLGRLGFPEHAGQVAAVQFDESTGEFGITDVHGQFADRQLLHIDFAAFFTNPHLWWGLLVGALLITATVVARRRRDPSA
jgi:ABC-2 type transport system permease protein